jgi:hypothetical protein
MICMFVFKRTIAGDIGFLQLLVEYDYDPSPFDIKQTQDELARELPQWRWAWTHYDMPNAAAKETAFIAWLAAKGTT